MINYFIALFGSIQLIISVAEFIFPERSFLAWRIWISSRYFPLHGAALILTGFPLTIYSGYLSSVIFFIGIVVVLTGPFILIYPEKIREAFDYSAGIFEQKNIKKIIRFDSAVRLATGIVLIVSYYKS